MAITIAYLCSHRFQARTRGLDRYQGLVSCAMMCPDCRPRPKVRLLAQDGQILDTGRTEGELNGWEYEREPDIY